MVPRIQETKIKEWLGKGKAIVVIGPRQVGKTTLIRKISEYLNTETLWLTGDDPATRTQLENISLAALKKLIGQSKVLVVDEAQRISNAGLTLKLITDQLPEVQLLITGSSSLDIAAKTKESLTGRKIEFPLFPLSFVEMCQFHGYLEERSLLEHRLVYGYYPEVVNNSLPVAQKILIELSDGLMYKDLLSLDQIKKPGLLVKLLQALALQVGYEVSYHELSQLLGSDPQTVERYIDLLEQSFVVFRLPSLSRNVRNEIKKGRKIYFYDNGIRNAILNNFNDIALRTDTGPLWENFLITERMKRNAYSDHFSRNFFWRTTAQQEIDYIEEFSGKLHAFEFKWRTHKQVRFPKTFSEAYPGAETKVIHPDNFDDFVGLNLPA